MKREVSRTVALLVMAGTVLLAVLIGLLATRGGRARGTEQPAIPAAIPPAEPGLAGAASPSQEPTPEGRPGPYQRPQGN